MKVIMINQVYPAYHPKKGEPTHFVEKIYNSFTRRWKEISIPDELSAELQKNISTTKHHTIRIGTKWKAGERASFRVWYSRSNKSQQLAVIDDVEIKKVWDVKIWNENDKIFVGALDENKLVIKNLPLLEVAKNDGLKMQDLKDWFKVKEGKPLMGQIISWDDKIEY